MRKLVLFAHMSLDGFAGDIKGGLGFLSYNEELQQFADELGSGVVTLHYANR